MDASIVVAICATVIAVASLAVSVYWDAGGLVALTDHMQDAVAVFLAEVADVSAGGFEDPQAE